MAFTTTNPLTTIFTPPSGCNTHWTYEAEFYNSVPGGLLIQNALSNHLDTVCFPSGFSAFGRAPSTIQIYSPAACPVGYATLGGFSFAATTTAICCPSGFSYSSTFSSINFFSTSAPFDGCISVYENTSGQTTVPGRTNDEDLNTTSVSGPITMWGQPITVEFQQADLSLFATSTSLSSGSSASSTLASQKSTRTGLLASQTASQTATSTAALSPSRPKSGISNGVIAGIVVVAAAVVISLLVGAAIFLRRRRLQTSGRASEMDTPQDQTSQVQWLRGELDGVEVQREESRRTPAYDMRQQWSKDKHLVELDGT